MSVQHDAIFLFQIGVGLVHMVLGTLLFLNTLAFYYLGLGIYPAVVVVIAILLIGIWLLGNRQNNRSVVYLRFASADQIAYFMQPLITIIVLNSILASVSFYIYTLTATAQYNSGFSVLVFVVGAIMFAHGKVPPRMEKVRKDKWNENSPLIEQHVPHQSYNETIHSIDQHTMTYPNTQNNAKDMMNRNELEQPWSL